MDYSDLVKKGLTITDSVLHLFFSTFNKKKAMFGFLYILKVCRRLFYLITLGVITLDCYLHP